MASRLLTLRPKIGGFAYFLRAGDTVDSVTVSATGKPDNDPTTNWTDIGVVAMFQPRVEEQEDKYRKPLPSGGYVNVDETHVTGEFFDVDLENMTDIAFEMMFGMSKITLGTAQLGGRVLERKVNGWLSYQGRQQSGTDLVQINVWVQARLREMPAFGVEPSLAKLSFQRLHSDLDTIVFPS